MGSVGAPTGHCGPQDLHHRRRADRAPRPLEPLLVIHGFPSSSFDFHHVVDALAEHRRVLLFDMIGYGLSAKPDRAYTIDLQADVAQAFVADAGVSTLALLTHDLGDTVGGELLARQAEGRWPVEITRRVLTNGSIYIEMAHLSAGQQLLLSLPDERLARHRRHRRRRPCRPSLAATFSPRAVVDESDLAAEWELDLPRRGPPPAAPDHPLHRGATAEPGPLHRSHRVPPLAAGDRVGHRRPHRGARTWPRRLHERPARRPRSPGSTTSGTTRCSSRRRAFLDAVAPSLN